MEGHVSATTTVVIVSTSASTTSACAPLSEGVAPVAPRPAPVEAVHGVAQVALLTEPPRPWPAGCGGSGQPGAQMQHFVVQRQGLQAAQETGVDHEANVSPHRMRVYAINLLQLLADFYLELMPFAPIFDPIVPVPAAEGQGEVALHRQERQDTLIGNIRQIKNIRARHDELNF